MKRRLLFLLLLCALGFPIHAQVAGLSTLSVLDMPTSARSAALGLDYLALYDDDITIGLDNPSLINERYHNRISLNYVGAFNGTNFGSVAYGISHPVLGDFLFGLRFNSYGDFEGYDENDVATSHFFAADYVFSIGWGRHIDSCFSLGVNLKPVLSQYDTYTAFALALDVSGSYVSQSKRFAATLMARNIGAQLSTFAGTVENLPFELSASLSYKLENAPLRFYFAATELQTWDLRYADPLHPLVTYDPYEDTYSTESWAHEAFDKTMRHAVVGVELSIGEVIVAQLGLNYRQMQETYGTSNLNTSGLSYGIGIRKKKFSFAFARNNYFLGKAPTYITLTMRL